jgi:ABC-type Fe3+/spermidine/putrescine transport system ATPase subunit
LEGTIVAREATHYTIRIAEGLSADVSSEADLQTGRSVVVSVRPERVRCPCSSAGNLWPGVVEDVVYTGELVKYRVRLKAAPHVTVAAKRLATAAPALSAGAETSVGWESSDAWILP